MFLEYINKGTQLVRTKDWKKEVKQGEKFEVKDNKWKELMRLYKGMFKEVKEEVKEVKKTVKSNKK